MKQRTLLKSVVAVAIGALAPLGVAHADFTILGNKVVEPMAGTSTPTMDQSQFDKLVVLGNVSWIPKERGAQGPMRSDALDQSQYRKLDILGNITWLPKASQ